MTPLSTLELTPEQVARLTRSKRETRVTNLIDQSRAILASAIEEQVLLDGREVVATVVLFSGGNDSTILAHLFRESVTHAVHANTTIGIEATREFVRTTCQVWGLPLIERRPPRIVDRYDSLVLEHGFPGPGHHFKMYQRLKERALEQVRREFVSDPRRQRIVFLAGRRRSESQRRAKVPATERRGSIVWVSPLVNWTRWDLNTYRQMHRDVPVNEVSGLIHMSGECCCGSFAKPGEREELGYWFPELLHHIASLEAAIAHREDIPEYRRKWGWGANRRVGADAHPSPTGPLCSTCDNRFRNATDATRANVLP